MLAQPMITPQTTGVLAIVGACTIWGLSPLFYKFVAHVPALEVLAHRTLWSLVFFAVLLGAQRRLGALRAVFADLRGLGVLAIAALMIATNWFLFIWAVGQDRTTESALGYYIFPLVAVLLGRVVFGEALSRAQWVAVVLAAVGVCVLTLGLGTPPWIALILAGTFGLYGMIKKQVALDPVVSVTAEVALFSPVAAVILLQSWHSGSALAGQDAGTMMLLILSGPVTAVPLILFSMAARRVRMATVGLVQYLNPSLQFACAVLVFAEPFTRWHGMAFWLIWVALALYSASTFDQDRAARKTAKAAAASGTKVT